MGSEMNLQMKQMQSKLSGFVVAIHGQTQVQEKDTRKLEWADLVIILHERVQVLQTDDDIGLCWQTSYGSVSAGREKWLFRVTFFYGEPSCGQTMQNKIDFSIDFG